MRLHAGRLRAAYRRMYGAYGPQHWWPGDSPFEIMVGAILTQNTAWSNVEKAMANLKAADCLSPECIVSLRESRLARLIRPSGYFNIKARRLHNFCRWYLASGGLAALRRLDTSALRHALLSVNGVGPETADDMLLYAFERPVFVVDAYTRRIFLRLGLMEGAPAYDQLRLAVEAALGADAALFNEYHALIVRHGKDVCRTRPDCGNCCLRGVCRFGGEGG